MPTLDAAPVDVQNPDNAPHYPCVDWVFRSRKIMILTCPVGSNGDLRERHSESSAQVAMFGLTLLEKEELGETEANV
ncbi:AAEL015600-PA [Aedes aegypti]|uniref:AAEL015600-PA n=1 Tax=Aedes aegypti TaxID=7159 RepID=Q1DGK2_AEDAE|nr:AAEL015600-PA [Aedes aegypti]